MMKVRSKVLGSAALLGCMLASAPALAADLNGVSVTGTLLFPDMVTPYLGQAPVTTTVGAGTEFAPGFFGAPGSIDVAANTITFATNYAGAYGSGSYNGYRLDFAGRTITGFALNAASSFAPLSTSFSNAGGIGSVFFNVNGQTANGGSAIFDVSVAAVPEPATWALMILGFAAVGGTMRRRSAVKTTVAYA